MSLPNTSFGRAAIQGLLKNAKHLYFLGIGGINMSSLARMSLALGYRVSGYDRTETELTRALAGEGITVYYELDPAHLNSCDAVIYTVAISDENPEYLQAIALGLPCISRADYLGYVMCEYRNRIGICGMHGKSTTTAMITSVFEAAGVDPTTLAGAEFKATGSPYRAGGLGYFIFEACEYKDSFLDFYPSVAVVLNIDLDHLDYFTGIGHICSSFGKFIAKTGESGTAVLNFDDRRVKELAESYPGRVISFGVNDPDADVRAEKIELRRDGCRFSLSYHGIMQTEIVLRITGRHAVTDALATAAAALACGLSPDAIRDGLAAFEGACRRMEYKGTVDGNGTPLYDDYAHHPTEISAALSAAKQMGYERVFCVFQPHTYSRTSALFREFATSLTVPGVRVLLLDIYAARETNTYGVSSEALAHEIPGAKYFATDEALMSYLHEQLSAEDCLVMMGAGDINRVSVKLLSPDKSGEESRK